VVVRERFPSSVRGAWRTLKRDPVVIGLPAAGLLLMEIATALGIREILKATAWTDGPDAVTMGLASIAAVALVGALSKVPLRALMIAAGARAMGIAASGLRRAASLLLVELVIGALRIALTLGLGLPALLISLFIAGHGWYGLATAGFAVALLGIGLLRFLVRALFGYAPILAVAYQKGPIDALKQGMPGPDLVGVGLTLFIADSATVLGGLCCGAGALPGYPLADLALLHRWHHELPDPAPDPGL
jgi:hypothetical protein